eukprot:13483994-Alexandrium_andersonii.AAC.1
MSSGEWPRSPLSRRRYIQSSTGPLSAKSTRPAAAGASTGSNARGLPSLPQSGTTRGVNAPEPRSLDPVDPSSDSSLWRPMPGTALPRGERAAAT